MVEEARPMPDVVIRSIKCYETTSGMGADDVIVWFKGEQIFRSEMKGGRQRTIEEMRHFEGTETIWVVEKDKGADNDDIIGRIIVSGNGCGEQIAAMYGDGSHYDLFYAVGGAP